MENISPDLRALGVTDDYLERSSFCQCGTVTPCGDSLYTALNLSARGPGPGGIEPKIYVSTLTNFIKKIIIGIIFDLYLKEECVSGEGFYSR